MSEDLIRQILHWEAQWVSQGRKPATPFLDSGRAATMVGVWCGPHRRRGFASGL